MKRFVVSMVFFAFLFFYTGHLNVDKVWQHFLGGTDSQTGRMLAARELALTNMVPILPKRTMLNVPLINQLDKPMLKNGCEVTSLAMLLNYSGINVTKNQLANEIAKVPIKDTPNIMGNPNYGFVGDMANGPGYFVYNGPIFDLAQKYVGKRAVNLTNSPFIDLLKKVRKGYPVWVITTTNFQPDVKFEPWETKQGVIYITLNEHSVVITGFDEHFIYVNDPYGSKNRKVDRSSFIDSWEVMGKQAIVIEK
jgi:uncharacterized protein YvpB